jgi:hypothetical protein
VTLMVVCVNLRAMRSSRAFRNFPRPVATKVGKVLKIPFS